MCGGGEGVSCGGSVCVWCVWGEGVICGGVSVCVHGVCVCVCVFVSDTESERMC